MTNLLQLRVIWFRFPFNIINLPAGIPAWPKSFWSTIRCHKFSTLWSFCSSLLGYYRIKELICWVSYATRNNLWLPWDVEIWLNGKVSDINISLQMNKVINVFFLSSIHIQYKYFIFTQPSQFLCQLICELYQLYNIFFSYFFHSYGNSLGTWFIFIISYCILHYSLLSWTKTNIPRKLRLKMWATFWFQWNFSLYIHMM